MMNVDDDGDDNDNKNDKWMFETTSFLPLSSPSRINTLMAQSVRRNRGK